MRVVYNNCNGLQIKDFMQSVTRKKRERKKNKMVSSPVERTKVARMLDLLRSWNANFVCMAETQTAGVKPGGTMAIWDGKWNSRIVTRGSDPHKLGQWSYVDILGRNNIKLCIFTVYRCCKGQTGKTVGRTSSYSQQLTLLKKRGENNYHKKWYL